MKWLKQILVLHRLTSAHEVNGRFLCAKGRTRRINGQICRVSGRTTPGWQGYLSSPAKATAAHGRAAEAWWIERFTANDAAFGAKLENWLVHRTKRQPQQ